MESPLAFDRDPLFGNLANPLIKIEAKLAQQKQRFWIWKEPDFFWFWNEDEPDFFGIFSDNYWFKTASSTTQPNELKRILHDQFHLKNWLRSITLTDPRPDKSGVWRILWRRRVFLLQNALTGRAVRFFPQVGWPKKAFRWTEMISHDSTYFAQMFWPVFAARQKRLRTAFEFLDLPVEVQSNPVRFRRSNREEFMNVIRAGLLLEYIQQGVFPALTLYFHEKSFQPIVRGYGEVKINPRLERLAMAFLPYLLAGFAFHDVPGSPFRLPAMRNNPVLRLEGQEHYTAHEQMEAIATIGEWVSQNAPELLVDWQ